MYKSNPLKINNLLSKLKMLIGEWNTAAGKSLHMNASGGNLFSIEREILETEKQLKRLGIDKNQAYKMLKNIIF